MGRSSWAGVDVGGRRKGFHLAVVDERLQVTVGQAATAADADEWLEAAQPSVVAIDSPCGWAPADELSRPCEREFAALGLCGIRFTPNEEVAGARVDTYLEWIHVGLELWEALRARWVEVVECFPTASWSAWLGPRGSRRRAVWTKEGIARLRDHGVGGLEAVRNQDQRDAVAAALTARQWALDRGSTHAFGHLVVPAPTPEPPLICLG